MEEREGIVYVEWVDSYASTGWQSFEDLESAELACRSVGWRVREDDSVLVIAPHISDEHAEAPPQGNGLMTIPRCAVRKIRELELTKRPGTA